MNFFKRILLLVAYIATSSICLTIHPTCLNQLNPSCFLVEENKVTNLLEDFNIHNTIKWCNDMFQYLHRMGQEKIYFCDLNLHASEAEHLMVLHAGLKCLGMSIYEYIFDDGCEFQYPRELINDALDFQDKGVYSAQKLALFLFDLLRNEKFYNHRNKNYMITVSCKVAINTFQKHLEESLNLDCHIKSKKIIKEMYMIGHRADTIARKLSENCSPLGEILIKQRVDRVILEFREDNDLHGNPPLIEDYDPSMYEDYRGLLSSSNTPRIMTIPSNSRRQRSGASSHPLEATTRNVNRRLTSVRGFSATPDLYSYERLSSDDSDCE